MLRRLALGLLKRHPSKDSIKSKRYEVALEKCNKCGICSRKCPTGAIRWMKKDLDAIRREPQDYVHKP